MSSREELMREADRLVAAHGTVAPPWVCFHEPINLLPRSEELQTYINVFYTWWFASQFTEEDKIAYFRRWPEPFGSWVDFRSLAVWPPDPFENEPQAYLDQCRQRFRELGFAASSQG